MRGIFVYIIHIMAQVPVLALYDGNLNFLGTPVYASHEVVSYTDALVVISSLSTITGTRSLDATLVPLANTPGIQKVTLLAVADPTLGTFYLNMTRDEYYEALRVAGLDANIEQTLNHIVTLAEEGDTFTFPELFNSIIDVIRYNSTVLDTDSVTYTQDADAQTGTLVFSFDLIEGDSIGITYHKA